MKQEEFNEIIARKIIKDIDVGIGQWRIENSQNTLLYIDDFNPGKGYKVTAYFNKGNLVGEEYHLSEGYIKPEYHFIEKASSIINETIDNSNPRTRFQLIDDN